MEFRTTRWDRMVEYGAVGAHWSADDAQEAMIGALLVVGPTLPDGVWAKEPEVFFHNGRWGWYGAFRVAE